MTQNNEILRAKIETELRKRFYYYKPYPKQMAFHNSMAVERVLSGGNRVGKSFCACSEAAFHCTGYYPDWYKGRRVTPVKDPNSGEMIVYGLAIGTDSTSVRDILQKGLIGSEVMGWTDGAINKAYTDLDNMIKKRGINGGAIEQVTINRVDGGKTILKFRSYAQGRENLQGFSLDFAYLDEEPPTEILGEIKARLMDRKRFGDNGFSFMAFTPLSGMTPLVQVVWKGNDENKKLIVMGVRDVPHIDYEEARKEYSYLPEHMQKARLDGEPAAGSGRVYDFVKEELYGYPPEDGKKCKWLGAIDFGRGSHWNVVLYGCHYERTDTVYITHIIKSKYKTVDQVANLMTKYNRWAPVAYPHDILRDSGVSRGKLGETDRASDGFTYRDLYAKEGVNMMYENAKTDEGSMSVEAGITEVRKRVYEGRLKIASNLSEVFDSMELYRYGDDNKPIKDGNEDEMDALRYLVISIRNAEPNPFSDNSNWLDEGEIIDETDVFK